MRLKQLLSVGLALPLLAAIATADSRLTAVSVQAKGNASTITVRATGVLTHNEYRPVDNLLLVDFPGATVGTLDSNAHTVNVPGVSSYQVHSYKAANGTDIARVELTLDPHAAVRFSTEENAVLIAVSPASGAAANSAAVQTQARPSPIHPIVLSTPSTESNNSSRRGDSTTSVAVSSDRDQVVRVRGISVMRGHDGTDVEIRATGLLSPKTLTLKSPDRLVLDLPNAIPETRSHAIPVHAADLNAVRIAQYQSAPPTTRVVLDLTGPQDFLLASTSDKLIVKLRPVSAGSAQSIHFSTKSNGELARASRSTVHSGVAASQEGGTPASSLASAASSRNEIAANTSAAKTPAQDFVVLEPEYHRVAASKDAAPAEKSPSERAVEAAKVLGAAPPVEIPLSSEPASASMKPEALKAAMMQAAQQPSAVPASATPAPAANCNTGRYTGEPISVNLKDVDLKDFFRLIHEISGLNVVLDPGVTGTLTIVLDDVPWDQALAIVLQNNSLQCQLNGNVLRIALPDTLRKEADAIRATQEAQALAADRVTVTRYLSYATAKNVVPTLKAFLSKRGDIISDDRTNSIIVQDIPSVIPGLDRLIKELDRKTPQVEIEARVVAATRSFVRDLGSQIGFGAGNNNGAISTGGASAVGTSPIQTGYINPPPYFTIPGVKPSTSNPPTVTAAAVPLFTNLGVVGPTSGISLQTIAGNYRLDMILTAAESRGLLKILSRPRIVTQNNILAVVRQGVRIPVVTAAQLGGPPTTTYIDAFLRLQVQPQITAEGTIFLNVDVENTTPNFSVNVAGNPELVTQQATTQVLVSDGGTVVIGGVIQTNDNITVDQVPFLGDVPLLGAFFKHKTVSTTTQELIFFITPRVIQS